MKKAPTVIPTRIRNLKNQNLKDKKPTSVQQTDQVTHAKLSLSLNTCAPYYHSPILNRCTWVFAATDTDHDGGEQKKEARHGEAHTVHRLVAHNDITVDMVFDTRYCSSSLAKSWDLQNNKNAIIAYNKMYNTLTIYFTVYKHNHFPSV